MSIFLKENKEERSGGTVDWPPRLHGTAILTACTQLDTNISSVVEF